METINRVIVSGTMARDPELTQLKNGKEVMDATLAVSDYRKNQQTGEFEEAEPNYIRMSMFGPRARTYSESLKKGMSVVVEGKLRWNKWERDGQRRTTITIVGTEIIFNAASRSKKTGTDHEPETPATDESTEDSMDQEAESSDTVVEDEEFVDIDLD